MREGDAVAGTVGAARPPGVHQVDAGVMPRDLLAEQIGVDHVVERHEGLAEERGERGLRLHDAHLGAGHLGGVAGEEVEHGLGAVEARDRRQHAVGVGGEEQDDAGGLAHAGLDGAGDVGQRVAGAGVLGDGAVGVIGLMGGRIEDEVLGEAAELDGVVDLGLALAGKVDALGVAASLDVEDAARAPAVLVIADEAAVGVGGERRLTGAGEAEEHRGLAGDGVDVGGAVALESTPSSTGSR